MIGNKRGPGVTQVETVDPLTNEPHTWTTKQEVEAANRNITTTILPTNNMGCGHIF